MQGHQMNMFLWWCFYIHILPQLSKCKCWCLFKKVYITLSHPQQCKQWMWIMGTHGKNSYCSVVVAAFVSHMRFHWPFNIRLSTEQIKMTFKTIERQERTELEEMNVDQMAQNIWTGKNSMGIVHIKNSDIRLQTVTSWKICTSWDVMQICVSMHYCVSVSTVKIPTRNILNGKN